MVTSHHSAAPCGGVGPGRGPAETCDAAPVDVGLPEGGAVVEKQLGIIRRPADATDEARRIDDSLCAPGLHWPAPARRDHENEGRSIRLQTNERDLRSVVRKGGEKVAGDLTHARDRKSVV